MVKMSLLLLAKPFYKQQSGTIKKFHTYAIKKAYAQMVIAEHVSLKSKVKEPWLHPVAACLLKA
jgi:hypothetical protein